MEILKIRQMYRAGHFWLLVFCAIRILWVSACQAQDLTRSQYIRQTNKDSVIVFVHGVLGDSRSTWTNSSTKAYWPTLMKDDPYFNDFDIFVIGYPSGFQHSNYTVDELVEVMRRDLDSAGVFAKHKNVYFLCHSMGGLVVRAYLARYRNRASQVPMIYFFSTPTTGAEIANLAILLSRNREIGGMLPIDANEYLASVQKDWLVAQFPIASYCAYETRDTYGIRVVGESSATNLCNRPLDPIDANHFDIVKPSDGRDAPYISFLNAVQEVRPQPIKKRHSPSAGSPARGPRIVIEAPGNPAPSSSGGAPVVTPQVTKSEDQTRTASSQRATISEDSMNTVEAANRMRNSLTEVLGKKETITFLMSWPDDDNTKLVFISQLLSSACRSTPRQCWFTQQGNPRDLDRPPVRGSGKNGITVHGPDAYALATVLGEWFTTYSTSSFPSELDGYRDPATKEIIWIEIGPGSPWKQTTAPKPAVVVQPLEQPLVQRNQGGPPQTQLERLIQTDKSLAKGDRDRLADAFFDYAKVLEEGSAIYYKANNEGAEIQHAREDGSIANNFETHVKKLRELTASAWVYAKAFPQIRDKWKYYPDQTDYIFGDNPDNLGPYTLINASDAYANYLENWGKISNKDQQGVLILLANQQNDFNDSLTRFVHWKQGCEQRLEQMKRSIQ